MSRSIPVTRSSMPDFDEYVNEIRDLWDSRWLTNMGAKHHDLEKRLCDYLKVTSLNLFANGHLALECAISAMQLTGEAITTPFTFVSTTNAIIRSGLKPVFCDINPDDYTIDVDDIERKITEKTSAIIPVHVYGHICDVKRIERIARQYGLKVIYDAAHTFGVTVHGKGIGNYGDASMFSFHATKVFNTIEGGAVTYGDPSYKRILDHLTNFGMTSPESVAYAGGNAKMNEFQAAMGLCNLRHVDAEIEKRSVVAYRYRDQLSGIKGIKLSLEQDGVKSNYAYFPVVFDGYGKTRDELFEQLKTRGIIARKYFYPISNRFDYIAGSYQDNDTPVAKYISERVLALPLYADLALEDVDLICKIIKG